MPFLLLMASFWHVRVFFNLFEVIDDCKKLIVNKHV